MSVEKKIDLLIENFFDELGTDVKEFWSGPAGSEDGSIGMKASPSNNWYTATADFGKNPGEEAEHAQTIARGALAGQAAGALAAGYGAKKAVDSLKK